MRAHGSDKLRIDGTRHILLSRHPKGWKARVPKTLTSSEHPGTAVLWEDQFFEVVSANEVAGGVRYVLEPWRDEHAIRVTDRYDEEGEAARVADRQEVAAHHRNRRATWALSMFAGHLPAPMQNKLGNELGIVPTRMTLISIVTLMVAAGAIAVAAAGARIEQRSSSVPGFVGAVVALFLFDAGIRFFVVMSQNRPMGSAAGFVLYTFYYYALAKDRSKLIAPLDDGKGHRTFTLPPAEEVALADEVETRGAFLSLLSIPEQRRLERTCGYDYRRHAKGIAWIILGTGVLGIVSGVNTIRESATPGAIASVLVGGLMAVEQALRLVTLQRGPAGSMFAPLVRPFVRRLLERE